MPAALSVYFPNWSIDLLRRRERRRGASPESPGACTLLVQTTGQVQTVAAACQRARAAGVRAGMTLAHARALLPGASGTRPGGGGAPAEPRIEPFDPAGDGAALEALARWCTRLAPIVAPDPPDGLLMDLSGCERVYGGRASIVRQVARAMSGHGLRARIALAPTFGCAWGMAGFAPAPRLGGRGGRGEGRGARAERPMARLVVVPDGRQREALAPLPVRALRLSEQVEQSLAEVAVDRVDQVLALPRAMLAPRFGEELLLRIDQALGGAMEVLRGVHPPDPVRAERPFDGPTTCTESIAAAAREVLEDLCGQLAARGRGARRIDVWLDRSDLPPLAIALATSRPTHSHRHLWKLLRPRLERVHLGFGVEGVRAEALRLARVRDGQQRWGLGDLGPGGGARTVVVTEQDAEGGGPACEMIDALSARLGEQRVVGARVVESHVPERVVRLVSALTSEDRRARDGCGSVIDAPRPTVLLPRPEPAEVIALWPDGPPSWLRWRGREVKVAAAAGPERVVGEWWRWAQVQPTPGAGPDGARPAWGDLPHRDYFRITGQCGVCLWLFRESRTGRWLVHGVW